MAGTPAYMAPEQVLDGHVSEAADWYAVGVMLFQALTGVLPHTESLQRLWTPESQETLHPNCVTHKYRPTCVSCVGSC